MHISRHVFLFIAAIGCIALSAGRADASSLINTGSLIRSNSSASVYYVGDNNKRYVFPNSATYFTWYEDFSEVLVVSDEVLASYQLGGNITYRPGTRLIKIQSDPRVFAVEPGGSLVWVPTEEAAQLLYGDNWNKRIDDVPVTFFTDYTETENQLSTTHPIGSLVTYSGQNITYVIEQEDGAAVKREFSGTAFSANRYQEKFIITVTENIAYATGNAVQEQETDLIDPLRVFESSTSTPNPEPAEPIVLDQPAFFVDSTIASSGDGSINTPFKTITEGIAALGAGDTLYVRGSTELPARTYAETINIQFGQNGNASSPIRIRPYPEEHVILTPLSKMTFASDWWEIHDLVIDHDVLTTFSENMIEVTGKRVTFDGIESKNGSGNGIVFLANAQFGTVTNSSIHDYTYNGSSQGNCIEVKLLAQDITISNSTIYNCEENAIELFGETNTQIEGAQKRISILNNQIYNETGFSGNKGVAILAGDDVTVSGNTIYNIAGTAINVSRRSRTITISSNTIYDSNNGLHINTAGGAKPKVIDVVNNLLYNIMGTFGMQFDGVEELRIVNNTLVDIPNRPFWAVDQGVSSGVVYNNLISGSGTNATDTSFKVTVSNNGWFDGSQPGSVLGANNVIESDARFKDTANNNYQLTSDSPAVDAGILIDISTTDANGNTRTQVDLGAFELIN